MTFRVSSGKINDLVIRCSSGGTGVVGGIADIGRAHGLPREKRNDTIAT